MLGLINDLARVTLASNTLGEHRDIMTSLWTDQNIQRLVDCLTREEMAEAFPAINPSTLERHRRKFVSGLNTDGKPLGWTPVPAPALDGGNNVAPVSSPSGWQGGVEVTGDSGTICSGPVEKPVTDWSDLLRVWGLDPDQFEVVEPVTFKAWDTPAKDENTQQIISKRLFSYKARIQRKKADVVKVDVSGWREKLVDFVPAFDRMSHYVSTDDTTSYVILVADPQLGKPGTEESVENWKRGITEHFNRIAALRSDYKFINEIVVAFMGDEHEGAVGNYANQPYEIELNYTEQIQLDFDMRVWTIKSLADADLPIVVSSVPSNHGEHTRFGSSKVMTSLYDNSSTMVTNLVKKVFDESKISDRISWKIANDRADNTLLLNGIKANFSHGHIAKGSGRGEQKMKSAIDRQILGRTDELGDTQLFFTAHYHHFYTIENQGRTIFGCPALEAEKSSKWYYDQYGGWSRPGMLGVLVGSSLGSRGWAEVNVL